LQKYNFFLRDVRKLKRLMSPLLANGKPLQQPGEFPVGDGNGHGIFVRPLEGLGFQPFHPETKPVSIPIENFDDCSFAVAESKQVSGKQIRFHLVFHQDGKPIN